MSRFLILSVLVFSILCRSEIEAKETSSNSQTGIAAVDSSEMGVKWGFAVGGAAVFVTAFGFIVYLASTDPTTFTHSHSH